MVNVARTSSAERSDPMAKKKSNGKKRQKDPQTGLRGYPSKKKGVPPRFVTVDDIRINDFDVEEGSPLG